MAVIGAGIVGASVAWHLAQAGRRVVVLDSTGPAAGASGASDGAVSVATKPPGPLVALACESLRYCSELAHPGGVLDGVFGLRPSYLFATRAAESDVLDIVSGRLRAADAPVRITRDGGHGHARIPGLGRAVRRVVELEGEGHMLGYEAVRRFLGHPGLDLAWPVRVHGIAEENGGVTLETDAAPVRADSVVLACGLGAGRFAPELVVRPRSGQLIITERSFRAAPRPAGAMTSAAYLMEKTSTGQGAASAPVVIDPLATGQFLIGSSRDDGGDSRSTDFRTVRRILSSAVACLPALAEERVLRVFAGVRAATPDGLPYVGPMPGSGRVFVAAGFEGDGICLAPGIGRSLARWICKGDAPDALSSLSPQRRDTRREAAS